MPLITTKVLIRLAYGVVQRNRSLDNFSDGSDLLDNPIADLIFSADSTVEDDLAPSRTSMDLEGDTLFDAQNVESTSKFTNFELARQPYYSVYSVTETGSNLTEDEFIGDPDNIDDIYTTSEEI